MKRLQTPMIYTSVVVLLVVSPLLAWTGLVDALTGADQGMAARSDLYRDAQRALDAKDWVQAEDLFGQVAENGGDEADAALYWQAYVQFKRGRAKSALQTLDRLERLYPESTWIDDAKALAAEADEGSGSQALSDAEDNELKIYALNSLMNVSSERAVPVLEEFLRGDHSLELKEKALFVLSQSDSPRAREILVQVAKGQQQPELAMQAIEYLGLSGDRETGRLLQEIYSSTPDHDIKQQVLEAMMIGDQKDLVLAAARGEQDPRLRADAVELLGVMEATAELRELYKSESSVEVQESILEALFVAGDVDILAEVARSQANRELRLKAIEGLGLVGSSAAMEVLSSLYAADGDQEIKGTILEAFFVADDAETLGELARTERDPVLRGQAIEGLGLVGSEASSAVLASIYESEPDRSVKEQILEAYFIQSNHQALIDIVRSEEDRELRQEALEYLSLIGSDEAVDFLLQAIEEK